MIAQLYTAYAAGGHSLESLQTLSKEIGLLSRRKGVPLSLSVLLRILQNPVYYGMFMHKGEMYQGDHEPIVSKQLFDEVQRVILKRGKPRKQKWVRPFVFLGMFKCGECGRSITAEKKVKKSGLSFTYYRCTKKGTTCRQKYLRDQGLERQVDAYVQKVALRPEWADAMLKQLEKDRQEAAHSQAPLAQGLEREYAAVKAKLDRLMSAYLEGALELGEYQAKKKELLELKADIKERTANFGLGGLYWLEPMKRWILSSRKAKNLASWIEKRDFLPDIGSNFVLAGARARFTVHELFNLYFQNPPFKNWSG